MGADVPNVLDVNEDMLQSLVNQPLPDAVDMIIWRGSTNSAQAGPFERFAAGLLVEAGAAGIRDIAAESDLEAIRLGTTKRFWLRFDAGELNQEQRDLLQAVESALNRIDYADDEAHAAVQGGMSVDSIDEGFYLRKSQEFLRDVSRRAGVIDELQTGENQFRTMRGTEGVRGGDWDISTRFANVCERLSLPFRMGYRFDEDSRTGVMVVRFSVPRPAIMPVERQYADGFASAYAVRLAGLLAWAAFSSGVRITQVDLTGCLGDVDGTPVISMGFDRVPFMMGTLPAMKNGQCDAEPLDVDPLALLNLLKPVRYRGHFDANRGLTPIEPLTMPAVFLEKRVPEWQDQRELPEALRGFLRADRACELDVMHDESPVSTDDVNAIVEENEDSPMVAELQLEVVLAQLGETGEAKVGANGEIPLYCSRPSGRLLVSLLEGDEHTRYWKLPDAVVDVHQNLGTLAKDNGSKERAESEGLKCVELGPTCVRFREELSQVYAKNDEYGKAVDVLIEALKLAVPPVDCEVLYYRLGYALWQIGRLPEALACYAMVVNGGTPFRSAARDEAYELSQQMGLASAEMSYGDACSTLRAGGVPVAPSDKALDVLVRAAIELTDAGFPLFAQDAVWMLGSRIGGDVMGAVSASLRMGVMES
ncbi:tetratricopeptide repeat protein [Bifidobacterium moukalabense]|uniref:Exopolyphosphatase n=1 Tax=Bifidobacterium moukalabense DSM 27321 TaxID=1435051 RepID=W4N7V3_9BIFI|nr:tetratricopeptide repeat protein [Bifidobacterium moukalabense]ETY70730.1 exopolyphosphatase [Bifidobacterium moukalabense DSM 27321]